MILRRTAAALVTAALVVGGGTAAVLAPASAATSVLLPAPGGLQTATSDADLRFAWDGVAGATGYTIEIATDDQFASSNVIATRTTTALSWVPERSLLGAQARTLFWRVASHSSGTTSASRGPFSAAADLWADAAAAPELLAPVGDTVVDYPDPVTFRWSPVAGAVSYTLTYSSSPDWSTGVTTTQDVTGTAFTPLAPLARTSSSAPVRWYWVVRANFASASTTTATTTTPGPTQPEPGTFTVEWDAADSAPTLLAPLGTDRVQTDLKFSWTPVAGAAKYLVEIGQSVDDATGAVTTVVDSKETTSTTYAPLQQFVDGTYYWQVTAYDPDGKPGQKSVAAQYRKAWSAQSTPSTSADGFTKTFPYPTFGSTDIGNPSIIAMNDLLLTWNPVPRATLYEVQAIPILSSSADKRETLTCRTASTQATIVARVIEGTNNPDALEGDGTCLWNAGRAKRMDAGGLYEWRVRAIDYSGGATTALQSATPTGTQESLWSDVSDGDASRKRFFLITPPQAASPGATAVVDDVAWTAASGTDLGKPAPLMSWSAADGADAYIVSVYSDDDCSVLVTTQFTTQTKLQINGVFDDETSGAYCWRVQGILAANEPISQWSVPTTSFLTPGRTWTKSSTPLDFTGVSPVSRADDGSVVLAWRAQSLSAPRDGGSRGYSVALYDSSKVSQGTIKVEWPWYVAKTASTTQNPLRPGEYYFKVAALDALGNAGNYTDYQPFTIAGPAPTALTSEVSGTTVTLGWTGTTAAARYAVKYAPAGSTTFKTVTTSAKQTSVTVTDLDDGSYQWSVWSYDASGYASLEAAAAGFAIASPAPALVTDDGAVLTTRARVLDWEPVEGASRYLVQYATSAGSLDTASAAETMATSYVVPATLAYGTPYFWQVTAVPEKATTASTRVKLGRSATRGFTVVNPPSNVSISRVTVSGRAATVAWATPTGPNRGAAEAPTYRLAYRAVNATGAANEWEVLDIDAGVESRTLTGLAMSTTYEFQLQAINAEGASAWSATKTASTAGVPGGITGLAAAATATTLKLTWNAPESGGSAITGYEVRYRKGDGEWVDVVAARTSTSRSVTLASLSAKSGYTVSVAAINAVGTGAAATLSAATLGLPSAPRTLKAVRGDRAATVTWTAPSSNGGSAITGYGVEYRAKDARTGTWGAWTVRTTSASTLKLALTGLVNGTTYQVRVAARSALGTGSYAAAVSVVPATKPSAPTGVKAVATTGKITVSWAKPATNGSTLSGYQVKYSLNGTTWYTMPKVAATSTSTVLKSTKKGKAYSFRVTALSNLGSSPASSVVKVVAK